VARPGPLKFRRLYFQWILETIPAQLQDLDEVLETWSPDAIVTDPAMWSPFLILHEKRRIPVAVFALILACPISGRDGPVWGYPVPRPRNRWQYLKKDVMRRAIGFFVRSFRAEAIRLRQLHGLEPIELTVTDFAGQMPLYLMPSSPEIDCQRTDLPPSVHYVGPCSWSKPSDQAPPGWLFSLPEDSPAVYVTEGTVNLTPRILKAAAQGLANLPIQAILTTGRHRDISALDLGPRPLAPNIRVEQFIPIADLLPHVDAVVTTGGPSTVMASLSLGIPLVIVPSDWDHPETAWRIQDAGVGLHLKPDDCTPQGMRAAVERVLHEPEFRRNALRVAASLRQLGGPAQAAQLVEEMLDRPYSPPALTKRSAMIQQAAHPL
jgi:MGT family glycosyltransferase